MPKIVSMMRVDDGSGQERLGVVLDVPPDEGEQVMLVTKEELRVAVERATNVALKEVDFMLEEKSDRLDEAEGLARAALDLSADFEIAEWKAFRNRLRQFLGIELPN